MWTHAILEIYEPEDGWPAEGTPADWIDDSLVGYCNGEVEDLILFTPMLRILWWKVKHLIKKLWWASTWRLRKPLSNGGLFNDV